MKCPFCGSTRLGHIIYGLPDYTEELIRRIENEEVYMGGCLIMEGYPEYHCYACGQNVGKRPAFYARRGTKRVIEVRLELRPAGPDMLPPYERLMTQTEWDRLLDLLYTQLYVHEWGGIYVDRDNPDGGRWELTITFTEDRKRVHRGIGGFPPYWEELKAAFLWIFRLKKEIIMEILYLIASICSLVSVIGVAFAISQISAARKTAEKCLYVLQTAKDYDHLINLISFRLEKSNDNLKKIGFIFEDARNHGYSSAVADRTRELIAVNEDLRGAIEKDLPECGSLLNSANDSLRNSINDRFWESKINFAKGYMEKCHNKLIDRQKEIETERDSFFNKA